VENRVFAVNRPEEESGKLKRQVRVIATAYLHAQEVDIVREQTSTSRSTYFALL